MKNTIMNIVISILSISCSYNKELKPPVGNSKDVINVAIDNKKEGNPLKDIFLKDYVSSIEYIGLETTEESLIAEVSKIYFEDNNIIIFDYKSSQVFFFDKEGKFLRKILKKGKAKDEYLAIATGLYDAINKQIIIYDNIQYKLLYYDVKGEFIRDIRQFNDNCIIRDLINLPNGDFLCYREDNASNEKYHSGLWRVNSLGEFVESYFEYNVILPLIYNDGNSSFQILSDNKILLIDGVHGDLYQYDNNTVNRIVNYNIIDDKYKRNIGKKITDDNNAKCEVSYSKKEYLLSVWFDEKCNRFYTIHNRETTRTTFVDKFLNNDMNTPFIMGYIIDNNSNDVITLSMDIDYLKTAILENDLSAKQIQKMKELISKFDKKENESTNYILELIHLK